jgi:glycosyltransferase involved in cell wall biosynthesis
MGMLDNAWKGADTAIEAFRLLPEALRGRVRLHLASYSSPPPFDDDRIRAYAWMPLTDIPEFLRGMDVMLAPSRDEGVMRETFSQAVVQGMLTGLPVLVSDLMVLREKVDAGGGHVVRDAAELAQRMAELAGDPARRARLGAEARAIALERYVWDTARFVRRYLEESGDAG